MNYVTNLQERKELLTRIIPKVPQTGGRWGKKLNWTAYFASNPFDAPLLGYDVRDKKPELWNRNNVLARDMLERGAVTQQSNGFGFADTDSPPPLKGTATKLLDDVQERTQLLLEIWPQLPSSGPGGSKSWKSWFEAHPDHAVALGYDIRQNRPKIWAANLRISQSRRFRVASLTPQTPLVPYAVEIETPQTLAEGIKVLEQKADIVKDMQQKAEIKELKSQLHACELKVLRLQGELDAAKSITFDLLLQLRESKG